MAAKYGALTDHWGLIGALGALFEKAVLVESSSVPVAKSVNRAPNASGDNVAEAPAGQTAAETLADVSCTYDLTNGDLNLNTLKLGVLAANKIATGLAVTTSNGAWPQIVVTGQINTITLVATTGFLDTYSIVDSITLVNAKRAQLMDFEVPTELDGNSCRLTGSSFGASIEIASADNGVGVIVAHGISGGVVTQGCELVAIEDAPEWTPGGTWIETQKPGIDEGKAAWHTASGAAEKMLARDPVV